MTLKPWASTTSFVLLLVCCHASGWMMAAPPGWKFWVGVGGVGISIVGLLTTATLGREK